MSFWERFQRLELMKKRLTKLRKIFNTKFTGEVKDFIRETGWMIVFYGILINFALSMLLRIEISVINIVGSGGLFYVFIDIVKLLEEHGCVLFKYRKKP